MMGYVGSHMGSWWFDDVLEWDSDVFMTEWR
jgi:hypothetical protein